MDPKGYLYVLGAAVLWGLIGPISKFIFADGVSALETAFWRSTLGWGMFAIHALLFSGFRIARHHFVPLAIFSILGITLFYGSYMLSIEYVGAALASVLLYTAPAWVALLSWIFLAEKMTGWKIAALSLTLAGVAGVSLGPQIMGGGNVSFSWLGILSGLTAGFTYALYYIFGKKYFSGYATPTLFFYALPVGSLGLYPFIEFVPKGGSTWLWLLLLAATTTYGAYICYYAGLKRLEATRVSIVATLEPVIASLLAFTIWNERFDFMGYLGSGLILSAVLLTIAEGSRKKIAKPIIGRKAGGNGQ